MINDVVLEGIVVRDPWKFMDDLFFRLVIYRDSDLPAKKLDLERDAGDYINVRVNGGANGLILSDAACDCECMGSFSLGITGKAWKNLSAKPGNPRAVLTWQSISKPVI